MVISPAQCRGARAMLSWSQDELSERASVARATIADFERGARAPMRQNMVSLVSAFEAWGIAFIADDNQGGGAGVRFRKVDLELNPELEPYGDNVAIQACHRNRRYVLVITRTAIDDMVRGGHFRTFAERKPLVQRHLPVIHGMAARLLSAGDVAEGRIVFDTADFPRGALAGSGR
jgi:DNA-binding XRE family transcriptional regulator